MSKTIPVDPSFFDNRRGPDGIKLSREEAMVLFPPLRVSESPFTGTPPAGSAVLVGSGDLRFWLVYVQIGADPGTYFGTIAHRLPDNPRGFERDQIVGFNCKHILDIARGRPR